MTSNDRVAVRANRSLILSILALLVSATALGVILTRMAAPDLFAPYTPPPAEREPDRFLVRFKPGASDDQIRSINAANRVEQRGEVPAIRVRMLSVAPGKTVDEMIDVYARNPNVEFAEPDYVVTALMTPSDPDYPRQWAPPAMNVPSAWDVTRGASSVVIAVVDTGVWAGHPDLAGQVLPGRDFVSGDADADDPHGHGTKVAGVIAAATNNGVGVAGLAYESRILPVRSLDPNGSGTMSMVSNGITWAADNGARVVNMSFGGTAYSSTLASAVTYAKNKGCVMVAAAGNDGVEAVIYPAGLPDVIGVGSIGNGTGVSSWSNRGTHVSLVAPGSLVYTTCLPGNTSTGAVYTMFSGTSAAAPQVSGAAALLLAADGSRTAAQVRTLLETKASDIPPEGWDSASGWGSVDVGAAIGVTPPGTTPPPEAPEPPVPEPALDTVAPSASIEAPVNGATLIRTVTVRASATDNTAVTAVEFYLDGKRVSSDAAAPYEWSWNTGKSPNGSHSLQVRAFDAAGNVGSSVSIAVTVLNATKGKPGT